MTATDNSPRIRSNYLQHVFSTLEKTLPPETVREVEKHISPGTLDAIRRAKGISMVPFELFAQMNDAALKVIGYRGVVGLFSSAIFEGSKSGILFNGILVALSHMLSNHRQIILMGVNGGWSMVTKNCGHMEAHGEEGDWSGIAWSDIPQEYVNNEAERAGWEGSIAGAYRALNDEVETRAEVRQNERRVVFWARVNRVGQGS